MLKSDRATLAPGPTTEIAAVETVEAEMAVAVAVATRPSLYRRDWMYCSSRASASLRSLSSAAEKASS